MTEISALKEVLMHAIEANKTSPNKTLEKTIRYLKRWLNKLHKERWKPVDKPVETTPEVLQ